MTEKKGMMLAGDFDLQINAVLDSNGKIAGGLVIDNSNNQDAIMVLKIHQGDLKHDPLLGPGLTRFIRGKYDSSQIDALLKKHFIRAGLDFDSYKDKISKTIKTV